MKKKADVKKADVEGVRKIRKVKTNENVLYVIGWILLACLALIFALVKVCPELLDKKRMFCIFHRLTGFYCPGCGGTRAIGALANGKIVQALILHPFVPYTALVGGWFMISHTMEKISKGKAAIGMKYRDGWMWAALALVILNFLIKNILLLFGVDVLWWMSAGNFS